MGNNLSEFHALCDRIRANDTTVTTVNTEQFPFEFTNSEANELGRALQTNSIVRELILDLTAMTRAGAVSLCPFIKTATCLKGLFLKGDSDLANVYWRWQMSLVTDCLLEACIENPHIEELVLGDMDLASSLPTFCRLLTNQPTCHLTKLRVAFGYSLTSIGQIQQLQHAITNCFSLEMVELVCLSATTLHAFLLGLGENTTCQKLTLDLIRNNNNNNNQNGNGGGGGDVAAPNHNNNGNQQQQLAGGQQPPQPQPPQQQNGAQPQQQPPQQQQQHYHLLEHYNSEDQNALSIMLAMNTTMTELTLTRCHGINIRALSNGLTANSTLETLTITKCNLSAEQMVHFRNVFVHTRAGASAASSPGAQHRRHRHSRHHHHHEQLQLQYQASRPNQNQSQLLRVDLTGNPIHSMGLHHLGRYLKRNTTVQYLSLSMCEISCQDGHPVDDDEEEAERSNGTGGGGNDGNGALLQPDADNLCGLALCHLLSEEFYDDGIADPRQQQRKPPPRSVSVLGRLDLDRNPLFGPNTTTAATAAVAAAGAAGELAAAAAAAAGELAAVAPAAPAGGAAVGGGADQDIRADLNMPGLQQPPPPPPHLNAAIVPPPPAGQPPHPGGDGNNNNDEEEDANTAPPINPQYGIDAAIAMAKGLARNHTLEEIDLSSTGCGDVHIEALCTGMVAAPPPHHKDEDSDDTGDEGDVDDDEEPETKKFAKKMKESDDDEDMMTNGISGLRHNDALRVLSLSNNPGIRALGCRSLGQMMKSNVSVLCNLVLNGCPIGCDGARQLARFLKWQGRQQQQRQLGIMMANDPTNGNNANGAAANNNINCGSPLEKLFLDNCSIGDDGLIALAASLEDNMQLRVLSVEENPFKKRGFAEGLARSLPKMKRLERIDFSWSPAVKKSLKPLVAGFEANVSLIHVNIPGFEFGQWVDIMDFLQFRNRYIPLLAASSQTPVGLWPHILASKSVDERPSVSYFILRQKLDLHTFVRGQDNGQDEQDRTRTESTSATAAVANPAAAAATATTTTATSSAAATITSPNHEAHLAAAAAALAAVSSDPKSTTPRRKKRKRLHDKKEG